MENITFRSLEAVSIDDIYQSFYHAFCDYDFQLTQLELETMIIRRGFVAALSFGAFHNDRLVSFTLNGIGMLNGLKTAYDTGTGTIKEYRGKGLAKQVFAFSVGPLKAAGVEQYLLEVLQHNAPAVAVYTGVGFAVSREFNYFKQTLSELRLPAAHLPQGYSIRPIGLDSTEDMMKYWDFIPSWQNSFDSVGRKLADFLLLGAFQQTTGSLAGYCIFDPVSGDITQLAVDKGHRRKGIASALLEQAKHQIRGQVMKLTNTEVSCQGITAFAEYIGLVLGGKQFEMIKAL